MKTISQLLELAKNPYYQFQPDERRVLDDFLSKKRESASTKSRKISTTDLSQPTHVTVRNVVQPADTYAPDERTVS